MTVKSCSTRSTARNGAKQDYDYEIRWLTPSGLTKHLHVRAHRVRFDSGEDEIVGALIDVSEARQAQEALHAAQTALAHAARVATLGEMSASIAHEVNQPLAGIVTNGEAGLRWLDRKEPDLGEVRSGMERMIRDGKRASQVVERLRALARKAPAQTMPLDLNEVITEGAALLQREIQNHRIVLQLDLTRDLPPVLAGRVELQQVVINLMMNGMQAMEPVTDRPRRLVVRSSRHDDEVLVSVRDTGVGIDRRQHGPPVQCFLHHQGERHGHGIVDRPVDRRVAMEDAYGPRTTTVPGRLSSSPCLSGQRAHREKRATAAAGGQNPAGRVRRRRRSFGARGLEQSVPLGRPAGSSCSARLPSSCSASRPTARAAWSSTSGCRASAASTSRPSFRRRTSASRSSS